MLLKKGAAALPDRQHLGTLEIHLPVERHQQLHGLELRIMRIERSALMHKLIRQILDRVAEYFKGMPSFTANAPGTIDPCLCP